MTFPKKHSRQPASTAATLTAVGWSGATLAAIAVAGLVYAPSLRTVWILILIIGAASLPQAWIALRHQTQRQGQRDRDGN